MIRNLSEAAETFGEGSGDLFDTVSSLARFTEVLAKNDAVVRAFMQDLAAVSAALADERDELTAALASVADAVGVVEAFVRDNRKALVTDVEKLTRVMKTINSEKDSIDTALTVAPVAIGNLVLAYDHEVRLDRVADRRQGQHLGPRRPPVRVRAAVRPARGQQGAGLHALRADRRVRHAEQGRRPQGRAAGQGRGSDARRRPRPAEHRGPGGLRERRVRVRRGPVRGGVMTRLRRVRGAAAAVVAGALLMSGCEFDGAYDLPLPGSPVDEDNCFEVTAEFADILNVVPRSPVMVDDVVVGEVTDVERVGWHAEVTMRVRDDVVLPDNAIADIRQVSLLGEKYVALEAPESGASDGQLSDGDNIGLADTGRNPEVEEVLGALSFLLSGGGVAQLGTIIEELNHVMSGREDRLRVLLGSLEDVVGTLDAQKADIIRALESMNNLTATLNAERQTITEALDVTGPAVEVLAEQHDELIEMLGALDELGVVGTRVIRASKDDLIKSLEHLRPVLSRLRAAGDDLAPGLNLLVSFPFPKEASEIVKGDYANTSIRAEISLDNFLTGGGGRRAADHPAHRHPGPRRGAQRGPEVPAERQHHQQRLQEGARRRRPAQPPEEAVQEGQVQGQPGLRRPQPGARHPARRAARRHRRHPRRDPRAARSPRGSARAPRRSRPGPEPCSEVAHDPQHQIRLVAFVVLSAVGIVYITASYLGLVDRVLGRGITVHATLPSSGGLFEGSEVTYRGVKIGKVKAMNTSRDGVELELALEDGTKLPKDAPMYVHNLSAVGEQYLDFEPADDEAPYVEDGDRLAGDADSLPTDEADLLVELDDFVGRSTRRTSRSPWPSSATCSTTPASRCSSCSTTAAGSSTRPRPTPTRRSRLLDNGGIVLQHPAGQRREHHVVLPRPQPAHRRPGGQRRRPAPGPRRARPAPPASSTRC